MHALYPCSISLNASLLKIIVKTILSYHNQWKNNNTQGNGQDTRIKIAITIITVW